MTGGTGTSRNGQSLADKMRERVKKSLQCRVTTCKSKREIGFTADGIGMGCADCGEVPCQDGNCKASLTTPHCRCFGNMDLCGLCTIRAEDGWRGCRHCMKEKGDLWWMTDSGKADKKLKVGEPETDEHRERRTKRLAEEIMNHDFIEELKEERRRMLRESEGC